MSNDELRDHFAGMALQGLLAQGSKLATGEDAVMKKLAASAYQWADKMLEAREAAANRKPFRM
jgi:hypothetical protein